VFRALQQESPRQATGSRPYFNDGETSSGAALRAMRARSVQIKQKILAETFFFAVRS